MEGFTINSQSKVVDTQKFKKDDGHAVISLMVDLNMDNIVKAILSGKSVTITSNISNFEGINMESQIFTASILEK